MSLASSIKPRLVIFDLDGTLYVDQSVIDGAVQVLADLRQQGYVLRFMTNTTTKTQAQLYGNLRQLGFQVEEGELISAPEAARIYLRQQQNQTTQPLKIWPVVADNIQADFAEFIIDSDQPDYVVLGDIGNAWTLALINQLFNAIYAGAQLIALHKNKFWQTQGALHVDIGLFVAGLEFVTGKPASIMGKPAPDFFKQVLASAGVEAADALLVGDDIDTDIGGAQTVGVRAALVQTGKYRQAYAAQSGIKPDLLLASVADLPNYLSHT